MLHSKHEHVAYDALVQFAIAWQGVEISPQVLFGQAVKHWVESLLKKYPGEHY